ncbi:hypothetical protein [Anditalea andensis]|uniref:Uncharacterized protein n=1 Tax=Anditalea andensis TaxID=1048983 RepID=A0A074KYU9_9BACT|nr:hypothetical protein [Anditalea andensis]KEO75131.1 hypothetical protein EL17_05530 [Anditalea andensis]
MRSLTANEISKLIQNQKQTESDFKNQFPDREMHPFIYYVPQDYMAFLMEDNKGIPPKINGDFPFIDDLLPLPEAQHKGQYIIVVNGEKYFYKLPFEGRP